MGKAIIIGGADFSSVGIGQVTPLEYRELLGITLSAGETKFNDTNIVVSYNPGNATYKELIWSIESGSEYAEVHNGVVTALEGADNDTVTVKAVSAYDSSIFATITIRVTYMSISFHDGLIFDGASAVDTGIAVNGSHKIEMNLTLNSNFSNTSAQEFRILLGGRTSNSSNRRDFQYNKRSNRYNLLYPQAFSFGSGASSTNIDMDKQNGEVVTLLSTPTLVALNDESKTASIPSFSIEQTYIVGRQSQADGTYNPASCPWDTIHWLKIWDSSDNLILHFVPAIYEGEAGFYDLVGNAFHGNDLEGNLTVEDNE